MTHSSEKPPLEAWNRGPIEDLATRVGADPLTRRLFELMRDEDLGIPPRDVTALCLPDRDASEEICASIVAREPGVVAGLALLTPLFEVYGAGIGVELLARDGARVERGDALARLTGPRRHVVTVERSVLNLLGRLAGVATTTARYVSRLAPGSASRLYDTRKTTPGLRLVEKYAVRSGGGCCHRFGLHDALMIKDNHASSSGSPGVFAELVREVAERARTLEPEPAFIEIEVDTTEQFEALLGLEQGLIDVVLLDNMPPAVLSGCVAERDRHAPGLYLEASGGITLETIGAVSETGVDRISVGALSRNAATIDFGLDAG